MNNKLLVFTDLDGTLLDHHSYSTEPAKDALQLLADLSIPLIFNTSKTRVETLALRKTLHNEHPFATENGSCLSVPDGYFQNEKKETVHTTFFGLLYSQIRQAVVSIRSEYGFEFTGFGDMTAREIAHHTGLSIDEAVMAQDRDCSEPIIWGDSDENLETFKRLLSARNMQLTKGGRFYHIFSVGDKGLAVHWLADHFHAEFPEYNFITIGLGDGINDLPMLKKVDYPVLVRPAHGNAPNVGAIKNLLITDQPGPTGWNSAVIQLIDKLT